MNFEEYRPLALRTAKIFPTARENYRHAALGLMTEIGEVATEIKRHTIYGKPLDQAMTDHIIEELGDAQWYVPLGMLALGADSLNDSRASLALKSMEGWASDQASLHDIVFALGAAQGLACVNVFGLKQADGSDTLLSVIVYLIDLAAPLLGVTPDEIRARNIAKLRLRFPDAYSDAAAEARADKGGLPATES